MWLAMTNGEETKMTIEKNRNLDRDCSLDSSLVILEPVEVRCLLLGRGWKLMLIFVEQRK